MKNKNGYLLEEALFGLFILLLCSSLIGGALYILKRQRDVNVDAKIEKKWFYND